MPLLGIRSADVIRNELGFNADEDVKRILKEKFDAFVDYVNINPIEPVAGAGDFLKALKQQHIKVGLATSSRKEKVKLLLTKLDFLQYFEAIVSGEEVENSKPAPDIFLKAAERLNLLPNECIVVEDGPIGVAAAKAAKMKCIAITATHPAEKLQQADIIIDTYRNTSLREVFEKL